MKEITSDKKLSNIFNISRSIAVLSVITAHTPMEVNNLFLFNIIKRFSSIGVIVFIIISGYYFNPGKYKTLRNFMKSKITTIVVPWVSIGSLVFLSSQWKMGRQIDILSWLKFLAGYNSYLYYLTVLFVCYLIYFYPVKHNKIKMCIISVIITIISLQLTAWDIIHAGKIYLTDYLNVFNWIGYFCLGILLKNINALEIINKCRKYIIPLIVCWCMIFIVSSLFETKTGYFSIFAIPLQILGAFIVFSISSFNVLDCKIMRYISRISFCVYLTHIAIVPVVYKFLGGLYIVKLFVPAVTLVLTAAILFICEIISNKLKVSELFYTLSGIRSYRKD